MASLKIIISISDKASDKFTALSKKMNTLDKRMMHLNKNHKKALTDTYNPTAMTRRLRGVNTLHKSLSYANVMKNRAFTDNYKPSDMLKRISGIHRYRKGLQQVQATAGAGVKLPISMDPRSLRGMERQMSRLRVFQPVRMRAIDEVSPVMQRVNGMLARVRRVPAIAIRARDMASGVITGVVTRASRIRNSYTTRLQAVDRITAPLSRAGGMIRGFAGRTFSSTIRVLDMATRPLQSIARAATSTLGMLGVSGGAYGGVMIPLKMVADRQDVTTQFEVMLGSAEAASKRVEELTTFAGSTPFLRDDIFEASRVLETFTGNALSTGDGLELIGDVAAGTKRPINEVAMWFGRMYDGLKSGRPVGDATMALQEMGAMSGETRNMIEELAESGGNIADIWPTVTAEFGQYNGMMEKMSDNLNNLLLGVKSFSTNTLMMPWGEGLESGLGPALKAFREWRGENGDVMKGISEDLKGYGATFGKVLAKPLYGIGTLFDEAFQNEDLDGFGEQMKYVVERSIDEVNSWLQSTGIEKISGFMGDIGETYGGGLNKLINGLMGTSDEGDSSIFTTLGELGRESAIAFGTAFVDELDPMDLLEKAFGELKELNIGGGKSLLGHLIGDDELKEQGSIWGTLLVDAMLLAMAAKFLPGFKGILAGASMLGGGLLAGLFGKSSKKGGKGFGKGGLIGSMLFGKDGKVRKPDFKKLFGGLGGLKNFKLPDGLGKLLTGFKGLPLVGTILSGFGLITGGAETMGENIGTVLGGLGGGALGSIFGPIGTTIGASLGALGGGKIGELFDTGVIQEKWATFSSWFNSNVWEPIKSGGSSAVEWISDAWTSSIEWIKGAWQSVSTWFMDSVWTPISNFAKESLQSISQAFEEGKTWIQDTWSEVSTWFQETVWDPIKNFAIDILNIVVGLFVMAWQGIQKVWGIASEWFSENVWTPLKEWASETWESIKTFFSEAWISIQEVWASAIEWFIESVWNPLKEWAANTWSSIVEGADAAWLWIQESWALVTEWFLETVWNPLIEAATIAWNWISQKASETWLWIQETWMSLSDWFMETVWTPLATWASETWLKISTWASDSWTWIQDTWAEVTGWFMDTIWTPLSTQASEMWENIKTFFSDAWLNVQEIWSEASGWFSETVWEPIKTVFTNVETFFGDKFDAAKERVIGAFEGVSSWFETNVFAPIQSGLDIITGAVEKVAGAVSDLIGKAKNIGSSITGLGKSDPTAAGAATGAAGYAPARNATGGYITKRTLSYIGENGNEFVIPVDRNKDQGRMYLNQAASMLGMRVTRQGESSPSGSGMSSQSSWINEASGGPSINILSDSAGGSSSHRGMPGGSGNGTLPAFESMEKADENTVAAWQKIIETTNQSSEIVKGIFSNLRGQTVETTGGLVEGVKTWFSDMLLNTTATSSSLQSSVATAFTNVKNSAVASASEMRSGVTGFFGNIHDDGMSLFGNLVDGASELPGRIGSAISGMASKAVEGASSMGNAIMSKLDAVLNVGIISGLNGVLDALGVAKLDTIDIPTFSTGTSNGRISRDTPGILNDRGPGNGRGGATQELIERRGKLLMPRGKNALVDLKRGDKIYNGAQTQSIFESNPFPQFSTGTAPGENVGSGVGKKGSLGTLDDVISNVWDYVANPKEAFNAITDSVSPDFSGFSGFPGKMLNGVWKKVQEGGLKFLTDIFKDNEGGNVDGSHILGKSILQRFGRYVGGIAFNGGKHYGIDTNHKFDPVLSPASGKVTRTWNDHGGGNSLELTNAKHIWWFMHLSKIMKNVGDVVKTGDHIATSGNSGNYVVGSGHLHTQVHNRSTGAGNHNAIDPMPILKGHATGGYITNPMVSRIGENGNEFVIPVQRNRDQGRMYLSQAATMLGMKVTPANENMNRANHNASKIVDFNAYKESHDSTEGHNAVSMPKPNLSRNSGGGSKEVTINFHGDIHVRNDEDINKIAEQVKRSIIEEIDEEYPNGEEVV